MWQRFTERARKVVFFAQEEAAKLGEHYVSTEHLLLGLLREADSVAGKIIVMLGLDPEAIRAEVERTVSKGEHWVGQDMQLTPRAKRIIDLAYHEARELNNNYIGTEHLLLGMISEGEGLAGRILASAGATLDNARTAVRNLQAGRPPSETNPVAAAPPPPPDPPAVPVRPVTASTGINRLVANALFEARELGHEQPTSDHFLLALFTADDGRAASVLETLGLTREAVLKAIEGLES